MLFDRASLAGTLSLLLLLTSACTGISSPSSVDVAWPEAIQSPPGEVDARSVVGTKPRTERIREQVAHPGPAARVAAGEIVSDPAGSSDEELRRAAESLETDLREVDLWPEEQERIGLTDRELTLCMHAPVSLAASFGSSEQNAILGIGAYWQWLNDRGGIYGRRVTMHIKDDRYRPETSRAAAEACKQEDPFLFVGAPGYDQTDVIRQWNEQSGNRLPYIHWQASLDPGKRYSFSFEPPAEALGRASARWIAQNHRHRKIGIVWRSSGAFRIQREEILEYLDGAGVEVVADISIELGQPNYTQEILRLQERDAEVVVLIASPRFEQEPFVAQATQQDYRPRWFLSVATNTTLDLLGNEAVFEGVSSFPAYEPGHYHGTYEPYAREIRRFEAAMRRYAGRPPDDLMWAAWLDMKQIHVALTACGADCTRDKLVSLMLSNRVPTAQPNCPLFFPDGFSVGTWSVNILSESSQPDAWSNARTCLGA